VPEQLGAFAGILRGFHRAELGRRRRQNDNAEAEFFESGENFLAARVAKMGRKKTAISNDDAYGDQSNILWLDGSAVKLWKRGFQVKKKLERGFAAGGFHRFGFSFLILILILISLPNLCAGGR
jgi:prepilin-type processing-associated H-X9-DG protein